MSELKLFLPITKVDVDQRLVYGLATAEVADRAGEICDYQSTKPYYEAWSAEMNEASGGKSLGALRAMHGRVAAGKITDIAFDDEGKRIMIAAKIVDDDEWRKVVEGVYTGFSQGGRYVRRWPDPGSDLTRYTAEPREISLVDLPAVATATFEVIKDGVAEKRAFASAAPAKDATSGNDDEGAETAAQRLAALVQLVGAARELSRKLIEEAEALAAQIGSEADDDARRRPTRRNPTTRNPPHPRSQRRRPRSRAPSRRPPPPRSPRRSARRRRCEPGWM